VGVLFRSVIINDPTFMERAFAGERAGSDFIAEIQDFDALCSMPWLLQLFLRLMHPAMTLHEC
jgi:hypothetical protein